MPLFEFNDYKKFLVSYLKNLPKKGYGEAGKMAQAMGVNSTMVSQVLRGSAHLSQEQALRLAKHLGLSALETEYFMNLVSMNRAGDRETESYFAKQLQRLQQLHSTITDRLNLKSDLTEENQSQYYSHWFYSAIWLLTAIPEFQSRDAISRHTNLPLEQVNEVLGFLQQVGLVKEEAGRYILHGTHVHVPHDSPHVRRHHINWREQASRKVETDSFANNFFFTSPTVIAEKDFEKVKKILLRSIEEITKITGPSPSEDLYCLNIDWFKCR
jgi:uncharacterized protein (TIGR02147 family)